MTNTFAIRTVVILIFQEQTLLHLLQAWRLIFLWKTWRRSRAGLYIEVLGMVFYVQKKAWRRSSIHRRPSSIHRRPSPGLLYTEDLFHSMEVVFYVQKTSRSSFMYRRPGEGLPCKENQERVFYVKKTRVCQKTGIIFSTDKRTGDSILRIEEQERLFFVQKSKRGFSVYGNPICGRLRLEDYIKDLQKKKKKRLEKAFYVQKKWRSSMYKRRFPGLLYICVGDRERGFSIQK